MPQPTIITSESTAYAADSDSSSTTRTYSNVALPANANTVIMFVVMDQSEVGRTWNTVTYGDTAAIKSFQISVSSNSPKATEAVIYDVSNAGAMTTDLVATINGANTGADTRLGVVCTTGFVESFFTSSDRAAQSGESIVYSPNYENNILLLCTAAADHYGGFSYTAGTSIFVSSAGGSGVVGVSAASQATNASDGRKTIAYTAPSEETADLGILLSDQRNPFGGSGGLTRSLIR